MNTLKIFKGFTLIVAAVFMLISCGQQSQSNGTMPSSNSSCCNESGGDSKCIDSAKIIYHKGIDFRTGYQCAYSYKMKESDFAVINDCSELDTLSEYVSALELLPKDSVSVFPQMCCIIYYHDKTKANICFGQFGGICFDGQKMFESVRLRHFIIRKCGLKPGEIFFQ